MLGEDVTKFDGPSLGLISRCMWTNDSAHAVLKDKSSKTEVMIPYEKRR